MENPWNGPEHDEELRREALLLDALRGDPETRAAARAEIARGPGGALALRRLEARLERARLELEDSPAFDAAREEHLIERVLAATTRAGGAIPAPRRTRAPRWPWVAAAAGILACLGALAERGRSPGAAGPAVEIADLVTPIAATVLEPIAAPSPRSFGPAELVLARNELATSTAAARPTGALGADLAADLGPDAPLELRLLEARARGLRERRWDTWLKELPLADLGTLSLALWCEVELDRFVLSGERPPAWKKAVAILEQGLEHRAKVDEGARLLAHALQRAREYGLTGSAGGNVEIARLDTPGTLWSREWFEDLEAAGHEAGLAESGTWRAWVDWRGQ